MDISVEECRVAVQAIATLAHYKNDMVNFILKPAGIPLDVYGPLLSRRDEITGRMLSKRKVAPLILDAMKSRPGGPNVARRIVEITAQWDEFHLADNEFEARATVQKAQEILRVIGEAGAREVAQRQQTQKAESTRIESEQVRLFQRHLGLLLMMFDELTRSDNPQQRGYSLEDLLSRTLALHEITVEQSFTRNEGGEQIDGAFKFDGWYYLVECRWRNRLSDIGELDGLHGKIYRSGRQTMGLFLSINGWSEHVVPLLKQNPQKSIILMDGYDLRTVLSGQVALRDLLLAKVAKLNLEGDPFLSVGQYLKKHQEQLA
jgi:hypothetical protein